MIIQKLILFFRKKSFIHQSMVVRTQRDNVARMGCPSNSGWDDVAIFNHPIKSTDKAVFPVQTPELIGVNAIISESLCGWICAAPLAGTSAIAKNHLSSPATERRYPSRDWV